MQKIEESDGEKMEENKNYGFKFNPDKQEKSFTDKNGTSKLEIEGNNAPLNMPEGITLANRPKTKVLSKEIKRQKGGANIGIGSNGFAGVITLAGIIAIAGVIIAYLTLKY